MLDRANEQNVKAETAESPLALELRRQMEDHQRLKRSQSYLGSAFDAVWGSDEKSLRKLEELYENTRQGSALDQASKARLEEEVASAIKADREALKWQHEINHYGGGFLKTAALFARGRLGVAGAVAAYALDQMRPADSFKDQMADLTLGGFKGGLLKGSFHVLGTKNVGIAAKGVALGASARALELGLTRQTYLDGSGNLDLASGLSRTVRGTLSKEALATDVVVFGAAHGLFGTANSLTHGAISRSPLLSSMLTGTTFGLSLGATGEIMRQRDAGEKLDVSKIIARSLIQGTIDTFAAAPGGIQAARSLRMAQERAQAEGDRGRSSGAEFGIRLDALSAREIVELRMPVDTALGKSRSFDIPVQPPESLQKLGERVSGYRTEKVSILTAAEGAQGPFADKYDFIARGLSLQEVQARVYTIEGLPTEIVVPESFAVKLDAVRQARLEAPRGDKANPPGLGERALPEDFIPLLDALPDKSLVKRLVLLNEANPEDLWHKRVHGEEFETGATSTPEGELTFYRRDVSRFLVDDVNHEWSHLLKHALPAESRLFDQAAAVERDGYANRPYAKTSEAENWAVHLGEEMLHRDGDMAFNLAKHAPVRSVALARALRRALQSVSPEQRSSAHDILAQRVDFVESVGLPRAQATLLETVRTTSDPVLRRQAAALLVQFGTRSQIASLEARTLNLSQEPITDRHVDLIADNRSVRDLDLSGALATSEGLGELGRMIRLERLDLSGTRTTNSTLVRLKGLESLQELSLRDTLVTESGLLQLSNLRNLSHIDIRGTRISPFGLETVRRLWPKATVLY